MRYSMRALLCVLAGLASTASAQTFFSTTFVGETPGIQAPDLGPAAFNAPGAIQFFQVPPLYVAGSNRAWGFIGTGTAEITFDDPVFDLSIAFRGTDGETTGSGNPANTFPGETLGASAVSLIAFDEFDNVVGGSILASNNEFQNAFYAGPVARVELSNLGEENSAALIGSIEFSTVPEAGSIVMAGLGATGVLGLAARRRFRKQ